MEKISKNKIKCSECGSSNTVANNNTLTVSLLLTCMGCMGTFICAIIPLLWLILPIFPIMAFIGFIGLILSIFIKSYTLTCNDCKSVFKLTKEEYKARN